VYGAVTKRSESAGEKGDLINQTPMSLSEALKEKDLQRRGEIQRSTEGRV